MADRTYTYRVRLDTNELEQRATQIRALMLQMFNGGGQGDLLNQMRSQLAQQQEMARSAASADIEAQRQMTIIARAETAERSQVARADASERVEAARRASVQLAENERRITTEFIEEERRRTAAEKTANQQRLADHRAQLKNFSAISGQEMFGQINAAADFVTGGFAAYGIVQLGRQAIDTATQLAEAHTEAVRTERAFTELSGGADEAERRLQAVKLASGGTADNMTAMSIATQAASLHLAENAGQLARLTVAARAIAMVSPTIKSIPDALTQLSLFASNENSFMRADQLGLSVKEVKDRMKELQDQDNSLSDSQAKLEASLQLLNEKFGGVLNSVEAQAGGMEKLRVAWKDFTTEVASGAIGAAMDQAVSDVANGVNRMRLALGSTDVSAQNSVIDTTVANLTQAKGGAFADQGAIQQQIDAWNTLKGAINQVSQAPGFDDLKAQLADIVRESITWNQVSAESLQSVNIITDLVSGKYGQVDAAAQSLTASIDHLKQIQAAQSDIGKDTSAIDQQIEGLTTLQNLTASLGRSPALDQYASQLITINRHVAETGMLYEGEIGQLQRIVGLLNAAQTSSRQTPAPIQGPVTQGNAPTFEAYDAFVAAYAERIQSTKDMLAQAQADLLNETRNGIANNVASLGFDKANVLLRSQGEQIAQFFKTLPEDIAPDQLLLRIAAFKAQLNSEIEELVQPSSLDKAKENLKSSVTSMFDGVVDKLGFEQTYYLLQEQGVKIDQFFAELPDNISPEALRLKVTEYQAQLREFVTGLTQPNDIERARDSLKSAVQSQIEGAVGELGFDKAYALLQRQSDEIVQFLNKLPSDIPVEELQLRMAEFGDVLRTEVQDAVDSLNATNISPDQALSQISQALEELNTGAYDFIPSIEEARNQLYDLYDAILATDQVTTDQATQLSMLTSEAWAAGDGTMFYKDMVTALGEKFFEQNDAASGVFDQMIKLQGAYDSGKISAEEHAGALSVLVKMLKDIAIAAGISGKALDDAFASAEHFLAIDVARFGSTPGYKKGVELGGSLGAVVKSQSDSTDRAEERREAQRIAKSAASEYEQALKRGAKAVEDAAQELQRKLDKIPGLLGTSTVTDQQMRLAAQGVPQNFVDDWRRRLEDEVKNGKDWEGVSIEQAKEALQRVGVALASTSEGILEQFNAAWADSSLFSDKENLGLINQDAVQAQLTLQEKIKTGQQNIYDLFGATVDQVNEAVASGKLNLDGVSVVGGNKVAASIDGKPVDATLEPKLKALSVSNTAIVQVQKDIEEKVKPVLTFDFGTEALAKLAGSINGAIANDKTKADFTGFGVTLADYIGSGFDGRTSELSWLAPIWAKMKYEVLEAIYGEDTQQ